MIDEVIIAVPRIEISNLLNKEPFGFINQNLAQSYNLILNNCIEVDRQKAETDESLKQLIPYVIIKHEEKYLLLRRKNTQSEIRLHNKMSIGVGGHLNPIDSSQGHDIIIGGLIRELQEEINIDNFEIPQFLGFINDDISEVGRVHLGLLFEIESNSPDVEIIETDKMDGKWASVAEIDADYEYLESWSKIAFDNHVKKVNV